MKKLAEKKQSPKTFLIGIPIILVAVLVYQFVSNYEKNYEAVPFDTIIYSSDRYNKSSMAGWHSIDLGPFLIEAPISYYFFLGQGIHGGTVGGLTNLEDTIRFAYGAYYFDPCEEIVIGEVIGTCDTLKVIETGSRNLVIAQTDSYISVFSPDPKNSHVFKAWGNSINEDFLLEVFSSVKFNNEDELY